MGSLFPTTPYPTPPSLRHFPRLAPSGGGGLDHSTLIIVIAVPASVVGLLLAIIFWRILSRLLRPRRVPLPPRQALVHQRELQLVEFAEYKDASVPQTLVHGSYSLETDEGTLDSVQLHRPPPQFIPSHTPPNASYSSLSSYNDDRAPSSGAATPTQFSTSVSPTSFRRTINRSGLCPRPSSEISTSAPQSIRGAPHAPHNNVQVVLPAPLAPCLYKATASDDPLSQRTLTPNTAGDTWRKSLADSWIAVGQHSLPDSEPMEREYGRDSMERPTRQRGSSPGPFLLRSRSNPSSPSRLRPSSALDQLPEDTHPPVPRVPSGFGTLSGHRALAPSRSEDH